MKALAPLSCWIPLGDAHLLCSEGTAVSAADVLGITVLGQRDFFALRYKPPNSCERWGLAQSTLPAGLGRQVNLVCLS